MSINFFGKNSQAQNYDYNFNLDLTGFSANDVLPDDSFVAFLDELSGESVLMQDVGTFSTNTLSVPDRLVPFYNKPLINSPTSQIPISKKQDVKNPQTPRGFSAQPNNTFELRKLSVLTAKFTLFHLRELNESLLKLKNSAPNGNVKNAISNLNTQVFVMTGVMQNIIRQLSNNPNASVQLQNQPNQNRNFCVQLAHSNEHADAAIKGMIKLKRMQNIPNISRQLTILILTMQNIISTLSGFNKFC